MPKSYIIIEMNTGLMDGYYSTEDDAISACDFFKKDYPKGKWRIFTPIGGQEEEDSKIGRFHADFTDLKNNFR